MEHRKTHQGLNLEDLFHVSLVLFLRTRAAKGEKKEKMRTKAKKKGREKENNKEKRATETKRRSGEQKTGERREKDLQKNS